MAITQINKSVTAPLAHLATGPCRSAKQEHVWQNQRDKIVCANCGIHFSYWANDEIMSLRGKILATNQQVNRKDRALYRIEAQAAATKAYCTTPQEYYLSLTAIQQEAAHAVE